MHFSIFSDQLSGWILRYCCSPILTKMKFMSLHQIVDSGTYLLHFLILILKMRFRKMSNSALTAIFLLIRVFLIVTNHPRLV